jgi:hypothetical protein
MVLGLSQLSGGPNSSVVEQRIENPLGGGSIPSSDNPSCLGTMLLGCFAFVFFCVTGRAVTQRKSIHLISVKLVVRVHPALNARVDFHLY